MPDPTEDRFRTVMSRFATGVTVMTSHADGVPHGMTANAVTSVSLDPLLVLVCVEKDTVMDTMVAKSGVFALSILGRDQEARSAHFANPSRPMGDEEFADVPHHTGSTGSPVFDDSLGWVECEVWNTYDGGDHHIVVGRVLDLHVGEVDDALVYYRRSYLNACMDEDERR